MNSNRKKTSSSVVEDTNNKCIFRGWTTKNRGSSIFFPVHFSFDEKSGSFFSGSGVYTLIGSSTEKTNKNVRLLAWSEKIIRNFHKSWAHEHETKRRDISIDLWF